MLELEHSTPVTGLVSARLNLCGSMPARPSESHEEVSLSRVMSISPSKDSDQKQHELNKEGALR